MDKKKQLGNRYEILSEPDSKEDDLIKDALKPHLEEGIKSLLKKEMIQ